MKWLVYVDDSITDFNYDMNLGNGLLKELGIILDFGAGTKIWLDISVLMKDLDASMEKSYHICNNPVDPEYDCV